jgi:hypothetical protein
MHLYCKRAIVGVSLIAVGLEVNEFVQQGKLAHPLPAAVQMAPLSSSSGAALVMSVDPGMRHFPSAITEAVYPGVANSKLLKNDGLTLRSIVLS